MTGWFPLIRLRFAMLLCALIGCTLQLHAAPDVNKLPKPTGYVSDLAHVVSPDDAARLEEYCTRIQQQLGVQMAIVTIDTLADTPIEDFSLNLARAWGVGSKKDNSGILLLVVVKDHKNRLEVGRGLEQYETDGFSGSILRSMRPDLRAANYGPALLEGAREIAAQIAKGKGIAFNETPGLPPRQVQTDQPRSSGLPIPQIVIGIFVLLFILSLFSRGGRGGGGGFWTGFLLSTLFNSGGGRGGGGWGGGGGFGGGSSGGGGFGGFGGGDFGGGGASSDW